MTVSVVSNVYGAGVLETHNFRSDKKLRAFLQNGLDEARIEKLHKKAGVGIPADEDLNYSPDLQAPVTRSAHAHFEIDGNFEDGDEAKFAGWDLSGLDLSDAKIRNMMFTFVKADNAIFDRADIDNTMLSGMTARNSSWRNVTFGDNVRASGCIENVTTDFTGADFRGTPFRNMNWGRGILDGAILPHTIEGTNFEGASLKGADAFRTKFSGTYMSYTHLEGANLGGATFHDMGPMMDLFFDKDTNLSGASFTGNTVPQLELRELQIKQDGGTVSLSPVTSPALYAWHPGR